MTKKGDVGHKFLHRFKVIKHVTKYIKQIDTNCEMGALKTPAASVGPAFTSVSAEDVTIIKAVGPLLLPNQREPGAPMFNQSNS